MRSRCTESAARLLSSSSAAATQTLGLPAGVKPGTALDWAAAFGFVGLPLAPNTRYEWRLGIDGHVDPDWCLAFNTVAMPPMQAAA